MIQLTLHRIHPGHPALNAIMARHYSQPGGFVGRVICYLIPEHGVICGGSSYLHLPGRDVFFGISPETKHDKLLQIVNNNLFHIEGPYPVRNFGQKVLRLFRERIQQDWPEQYGQTLIGFESLVELPRTGEVYRRDGWTEVGVTKGQTVRRMKGLRGHGLKGKRVRNTIDLHPKLVFVRLP